VRLVTVAAYPQAYEAHLARSLLEDAGIPAFVAGEYGSLFPADGDIRVRVPEDAADDARAVLKAADGDPGGAPE
jgi:hypothetical protein